MFTSYPVIKQLEENENGYRDVLKEVLMSESNLIVLDCEQKILGDVLMQAQQVGTISQGYFYLLTSLDAHVVNLDNYKYGGTNFTAFRLIDVDKPEVQNVIYGIVESIMDSDLRSGHVVVPEGIELSANLREVLQCPPREDPTVASFSLEAPTSALLLSIHLKSCYKQACLEWVVWLT